MTIYLILFQISEVALTKNPKQLGSFPREVTHKYFYLRPFHAQNSFTSEREILMSNKYVLKRFKFWINKAQFAEIFEK